MVSKILSNAASEFNVCVAGAVLFVAYSVLKRTNVFLFDDSAITFGPDFVLAFGYTQTDVLAAANGVAASAQPIVVAAAVANVAAILTYAFLGSAVISWAAESLGKAGEGFKNANVLPIINGALHAVEAVTLTFGILTVSDELAASAASIAGARYYMAIVTLLLGAAASAQFLWVWIKSIGRDGRQKIEKKD
ncbi:hypothetical protein BC830DRAFT_1173945 [Chytriomyces sp. MP71]|nr:hypothetical protein BC830DRAFT_1173945 [Chytriomyces sp. MP71]